MSEIKKKLFNWCNASLEELHQPIALSIKPLREEASFRRYFRLKRKEDSIIGVYSPPEMESNKEFIFFSKHSHVLILRTIKLNQIHITRY